VAKGAVGLVAGYWPDDVYRYLAIPGLSLDDGLILRPARRRGEQPALVAESEPLTYQQLAQEMERCALLLRGALGEEGRRIALLVPHQPDLARLVLGGLRARCISLLLDPHLPAPELAGYLDGFRPDLVIVGHELDAGVWKEEQRGRRVISARELLHQEPDRPVPLARLDLKAPAVALVGPGRSLVYHSHATLLAWAVSWSAFVPITDKHVFLSLEPLHRWAGLMTALAVLFRGGTCLLGRPESAGEVADQLHRHRPHYMLSRFADAAALASANSSALVEELRQTVQGVFVSIERPFRVKERRQVESAFGVPVLTVLGNAASGPAMAAHPSWYLDESVGIPVTNVDPWPLHPATGEPLAVPWEAIDYGELGVRSPMLAADYQTPEDRANWVKDGWLRMGMIALMDPSGLFYLRPWR